MFEPTLENRDYPEAFDLAIKALEERPKGKWITIEAGEDLLIDHYWYLIVHKDFKTPMKALYHSDCPHFTFFYERGEGCSYLFEDKITHYMDLPDIPIVVEECDDYKEKKNDRTKSN